MNNPTQQVLAIVNEVTQAANEAGDLFQVLNFAMRCVVTRLGLAAGLLFLSPDGSDWLTLVAYHGISDEQAAACERNRQISGPQDWTQRAATERQSILVRDMSVTFMGQGVFAERKDRSGLVLPLLSKKGILGVVSLIGQPAHPMTTEEVAVYEAVGRQIALITDNALLLAEARRNEEIAQTLYQVGREVSTLDLNTILEAVARGARQLLQADASFVGLWDTENERLDLTYTNGDAIRHVRGIKPPQNGPLALKSLLSGEPVLIEGREKGTCTGNDASCALASPERASLLAIPLHRGHRVHGLVYVCKCQTLRFSDGDIEMLRLLSRHVVTAIENALLYQQVRSLAVLEESERLSREMHDNLAPTLAHIKLSTSVIEQRLQQGNVAQAIEILCQLREIADRTYLDVREAIFNLRTEVTHGLRLSDTLRGYLEDYQAYLGLRTELDIADESLAVLPSDTAIQVLRIIQEALTNVRKHAGASQVAVRFVREGDHVLISVEDNGCGFDATWTDRHAKQHFGHEIMRERAESIGGALEIISGIGVGTRVLLRVPLPQEGE